MAISKDTRVCMVTASGAGGGVLLAAFKCSTEIFRSMMVFWICSEEPLICAVVVPSVNALPKVIWAPVVDWISLTRVPLWPIRAATAEVGTRKVTELILDF